MDVKKLDMPFRFLVLFLYNEETVKRYLPLWESEEIIYGLRKRISSPSRGMEGKN